MKNTAKKLKPMHLNLDPVVHSALMDLSEATGIPASQFVGQVLRASCADFHRLADAARATQASINHNLREMAAA